MFLKYKMQLPQVQYMLKYYKRIYNTGFENVAFLKRQKMRKLRGGSLLKPPYH